MTAPNLPPDLEREVRHTERIAFHGRLDALRLALSTALSAARAEERERCERAVVDAFGGDEIVDASALDALAAIRNLPPLPATKNVGPPTRDAADPVKPPQGASSGAGVDAGALTPGSSCGPTSPPSAPTTHAKGECTCAESGDDPGRCIEAMEAIEATSSGPVYLGPLGIEFVGGPEGDGYSGCPAREYRDEFVWFMERAAKAGVTLKMPSAPASAVEPAPPAACPRCHSTDPKVRWCATCHAPMSEPCGAPCDFDAFHAPKEARDAR